MRDAATGHRRSGLRIASRSHRERQQPERHLVAAAREVRPSLRQLEELLISRSNVLREAGRG